MRRFAKFLDVENAFVWRLFFAAAVGAGIIGGLDALLAFGETEDWVLVYRSWLEVGAWVVGMSVFVGLIVLTRSKTDQGPHHG